MKIDRETYDQSLKMCWMIAMGASNVDTASMLEAMRAAETTTPILDPTLWIQKHAAFEEDKKIVEAVQALGHAYRALEKARNERDARRDY